MPSDNLPLECYYKMSATELSGLCKALGIDNSGSKSQLINALGDYYQLNETQTVGQLMTEAYGNEHDVNNDDGDYPAARSLHHLVAPDENDLADYAAMLDNIHHLYEEELRDDRERCNSDGRRKKYSRKRGRKNHSDSSSTQSTTSSEHVPKRSKTRSSRRRQNSYRPAKMRGSGRDSGVHVNMNVPGLQASKAPLLKADNDGGGCGICNCHANAAGAETRHQLLRNQYSSPRAAPSGCACNAVNNNNMPTACTNQQIPVEHAVIPAQSFAANQLPAVQQLTEKVLHMHDMLDTFVCKERSRELDEITDRLNRLEKMARKNRTKNKQHSCHMSESNIMKWVDKINELQDKDSIEWLNKVNNVDETRHPDALLSTRRDINLNPNTVKPAQPNATSLRVGAPAARNGLDAKADDQLYIPPYKAEPNKWPAKGKATLRVQSRDINTLYQGFEELLGRHGDMQVKWKAGSLNGSGKRQKKRKKKQMLLNAKISSSQPNNTGTAGGEQVQQSGTLPLNFEYNSACDGCQVPHSHLVEHRHIPLKQKTCTVL